jgi:hypothetical protein
MINKQQKTYEVGNLGATPTNLFVGKTHISSNDKLHINNNQSVFLFASLTAGKNVRIDQATEKEPQIFIDAKFYDFKPYGYLVNYSANKDLKLLEAAFNSPGVNLKTIIDSIGVYQGDSVINFKAISSSRGIVIEEVNNELILKSSIYDLQNKGTGIKLFTGRSKDANSNYEFSVNKLIEGNCIKFKQIMEFTWEDNSSSSDSSSSDSSSSYLIKTSSSSSSSDNSSSSKLSNSSNSSSSDSSQSLDCCALSKIKGFNFEVDFDISSLSSDSSISSDSSNSPSSNSSSSISSRSSNSPSSDSEEYLCVWTPRNWYSYPPIYQYTDTIQYFGEAANGDIYQPGIYKISYLSGAWKLGGNRSRWGVLHRGGVDMLAYPVVMIFGGSENGGNAPTHTDDGAYYSAGYPYGFETIEECEAYTRQTSTDLILDLRTSEFRMGIRGEVIYDYLRWMTLYPSEGQVTYKLEKISD